MSNITQEIRGFHLQWNFWSFMWQKCTLSCACTHRIYLQWLGNGQIGLWESPPPMMSSVCPSFSLYGYILSSYTILQFSFCNETEHTFSRNCCFEPKIQSCKYRSRGKGRRQHYSNWKMPSILHFKRKKSCFNKTIFKFATKLCNLQQQWNDAFNPNQKLAYWHFFISGSSTSHPCQSIMWWVTCSFKLQQLRAFYISGIG